MISDELHEEFIGFSFHFDEWSIYKKTSKIGFRRQKKKKLQLMQILSLSMWPNQGFPRLISSSIDQKMYRRLRFQQFQQVCDYEMKILAIKSVT